MKKLIFTQVPKKYKAELSELIKESNYKKLMILGIALFVIQLFATSQNLIKPFSTDATVMQHYYRFYILTILLNIILFLLVKVTKNKYPVKDKYYSLILMAYMYLIHFWGMGVAIADQFQGQDVVVYYLSMFFISILINISVLKLAILLLSINGVLYLLLPLYASYIGGGSGIAIISLQFIFFSLVIRYYLGELTIKNYLQNKRLEHINSQLEHLSYYDSLSNLYNRRKWESDFQLMYSRCVQEKKCLAVVLVDIDYFKQYNDYYGHVKGDEIIKSISESLLTVYRNYQCNIGRYGGDEFIVSLVNISESQNYQLIKELKLLIDSLEIENIESKHNSCLSVSAGSYISIPEEITGQWDFVAKADKNLYKQKENR